MAQQRQELNNIMSRFKNVLLILSLTLLSACATIPGGTSKDDPFESYNRAMFSFNDGLDEHIVKPIAEGYDAVVPSPVKTGVSNFFSNIGDIFVILNDLLQFKFSQAAQDTGRFLINSTFGLYGLFDVATPMGLTKNHEDFGQTLATWGVASGPYIVLPFYGPRTLRSTGGLIVETILAPINEIKNQDTFYATFALETIDARYNLLDESRIVDQAALDEYSFVRDAYLQHRKNLIYDGNPPEDKTSAPPKSSAEDLELEKLLGL